VVSALSRAGRLVDTYLIFTSDYGYHMGLRRVRGAKRAPYTEAHEVPFVVRGPHIPWDESFDDLVANTGFAPNRTGLGRALPSGWVDGRGFAPFLDGRASEVWRCSLLVEGVVHERQKRRGYSGVRPGDLLGGRKPVRSSVFPSAPSQGFLERCEEPFHVLFGVVKVR